MPMNNSDFDLRGLDDFIREHGEEVWYSQGARCPCGPDPSTSDFTCPRCQGLGHFYPYPAQLKMITTTNPNFSREIMSIPGFVIPGDMVMVMRPLRGNNILAVDFDKVVWARQDAVPSDGENVLADASGVDVLKETPILVIDAFGADQNNALLTFTPGTDFTVAGTIVTWLTGNRPRPGLYWTIRYTYQPEWIVFAPPTEKFERNTSLGQTVLVRRKVVVLSQGRAGLAQ